MPKGQGLQLLKASTALTTAYASGWESAWIDVGESKQITVLLDITKGADAVSIELKAEVAVKGTSGTTAGYEVWKVVSGSASLAETQITTADLGATHALALGFDVSDVRMFRLLAKKTGGVAAATMVANASRGG